MLTLSLFGLSFTAALLRALVLLPSLFQLTGTVPRLFTTPLLPVNAILRVNHFSGSILLLYGSEAFVWTQVVFQIPQDDGSVAASTC